MHRGADRFVIRLPDGMRDRIKESARANHRSMNAEIIDVLAFHFFEKGASSNVGTPLTDESAATVTAEIAHRLSGEDQQVSLRDEFAIAALPAIISRYDDPEKVARDAYELADAMLAEREKVA